MFKNKSLLVTPVTTPTNGEDSKPESYSGPSHMFELNMLLRENIPNVVLGIVAVKGCFTLFHAAEHILVTKIK